MIRIKIWKNEKLNHRKVEQRQDIIENTIEKLVELLTYEWFESLWSSRDNSA
jgi:hypothetical protein